MTEGANPAEEDPWAVLDPPHDPPPHWSRHPVVRVGIVCGAASLVTATAIAAALLTMVWWRGYLNPFMLSPGVPLSHHCQEPNPPAWLCHRNTFWPAEDARRAGR